MALKIKIGKADHEALDDSLKTLYVPDGDNFKLDADYEDVSGLKNKAAELLAEQKRLKEQMKQFEGLDPDAARAAIEAAEQAKHNKLKDEGNFDAIKEQYEERLRKAEEKAAAEFEAIANEKNSILANLKRERLANVLTEKGVLPDRVKYLARELDNSIELVSGDNGFSLKKIGGIGDAAEFDAIIEDVKQKTPFFFAANNIPGSGASGSDGSGTDGKQMPRAKFEQLPPGEAMAFVTSGGKLTE